MTLDEFKEMYPEGMKFKVLDETYTLKYQSDAENYKLRNANGITELYSKEIILDPGDTFSSIESINCVELYWERVLRHELIHAFFHELGLRSYCDDEFLVEVLAQKFPALDNILSQVTSDTKRKKK